MSINWTGTTASERYVSGGGDDTLDGGDAPTWTLVANGDVDLSGSFADDYVVAVDMV